ncbi:MULTISPECIES: RNA polymerase factor sigma-54 [unclassified Variovorax]|jgi:RNA polymerase sigma-54 factor|uniref:RNA polymerase factor sigma-54 n=1 Tax=Variovorax TaxID=34072 RepID=UPI0008F20706|nr:RNA polymerase factor sigma-54 [Variovorax sp. PDC80]QRF58343.1 RNA polymerase factor sigma-54 [Variovorax paradoxus]SFP44811.1 RNA polymerase, sigma 54 subunit, RpoN/SigL [Variovorax sp. PDC80]
MKQGLSLRVSQHLALTPQLQQSIRLLQLSTLELSQEVEQMLDENPFLERTAEEAAREEFGLDAADTPAPREDTEREAESDYASAAPSTSTTSTETTSSSEAEPALDSPEREPDWEGDGTVDMAPDDSEWGSDAPARNNSSTGDDERADATELARSQESLQSFLHRQALSLRLNENDSAALRFLIESLNDDGYLEDSLPALASGLAGDDNDQFDELVHHFQVALGLLQSLEPAGVGARDLGECLAIQLRALADEDETEDEELVRKTALAICKQPMELLARRDFKRLATLTRTNEELVRSALQIIARLEPKPGRRFVDVERNIVIPDVIVTKTGRGTNVKFRVMLNPEVMPRLRVHDIYAGALKSHKGEGSQALSQRLQEARWFIKNIQQRFDTILRVSNAIVERQKSYFVHGELAMRPLVLREIADELGLHESTISRVTTAKYMSTPFGTVELKYFFGSALGTETGGNASSTAVRALIKQFVGSESVKKPLSDSQISEMLKEQGIECARRTVAKYREALRIAPANLRKAL